MMKTLVYNKSTKIFSEKYLGISRRFQKPFSRVDDENDVINKFDKILNNLRQDNPKYEGDIRQVTNDVELKCKFTNSVWGDYDAPVNKMFDRSKYVTLELRSGDRFVLVTGRGVNSGKPLAYLTKSKNKWYYLESSALSKLMSKSEPYDPNKKEEKGEKTDLKIDSIESARTSAHNYAKNVFGDSYDKDKTDEVFDKLSETYNYLDPVAIFKIYQNSCHGGFRRKKDED